MPLALELAATWLRVMPCAQIARQVRADLDFLTTRLRNVSERHRSMRAVFDHSWTLLSDQERQVLASLSVFRGGFDAEAAEQVSEASLSLLADLADKSLIRLQPSGRYDLHELLRQYAAERLTGYDEPEAHRRHLAYVLALAERAEPHLLYGSASKQQLLARLEGEADNIRAALIWALNTEDAELAVRLAGALGWYWVSGNYFREGHMWLERALAKPFAGPSAWRAKVQYAFGFITNHFPGDLKRAIALCEAAVSTARQVGDKTVLATALSTLGLFTEPPTALPILHEARIIFEGLGHRGGVLLTLGNEEIQLANAREYEQAFAVQNEGLALARELGDVSTIAWLLFDMSELAWRQGDRDRCRSLCGESLTLFRDLPDRGGQLSAFRMLGILARFEADIERAKGYYVKALRLALETGAYSSLACLLLDLARLSAATHCPIPAATIFGAVHAHSQLFGDPFCDSRAEFADDMAIAQAELSETDFNLAFAKGMRLSLDEAANYLLEELGPTSSSGLTP